jgi:hypothetical protein
VGNFVAYIDRRQEKQYLARFASSPLDRVKRKAATAAGAAAKPILKGAAPVGSSRREGQFYRREGYGHGTFRGSIRSRAIRRTGRNIQTVGVVVGPMGKTGFTRAWREGGTRPHGGHPGSRGTHWLERAAPGATAAASGAADAILTRYGASGRG